ncbi:uncharacterized protein LOC112553598 [Pomacea canaliculata]|uniref:uncharacterized protein LOC112553598 n=1 Tax=Pomacea canaliculata TaxID=400727 RepID=UPI000D727A7F|nr:uncharacterized protein LOC112553598 [Pomacea canaliculata]
MIRVCQSPPRTSVPRDLNCTQLRTRHCRLQQVAAQDVDRRSCSRRRATVAARGPSKGQVLQLLLDQDFKWKTANSHIFWRQTLLHDIRGRLAVVYRSTTNHAVHRHTRHHAARRGHFCLCWSRGRRPVVGLWSLSSQPAAGGQTLRGHRIRVPVSERPQEPEDHSPNDRDVKVQHGESRPESTLDFVWVENTGLRFTTKSLMSMRRNNETKTVCISNNINLFKLRLDWVLEEDTKASRGDQSQMGASEEDTGHVTTVFHNTVTMSGPRLLVLIFWTPVSNLERQLMRNVQKLFGD